MKNRIQQIIDYKNITAGDLAEILEVQRSNISHILNGRNNPGAAFIEKLLQAFPEINARWLITGQGTMIPDNGNKVNLERAMEAEHTTEQQITSPVAPVPVNTSAVTGENKTVDKIVLLYTDGTFTLFNNP